MVAYSCWYKRSSERISSEPSYQTSHVCQHYHFCSPAYRPTCICPTFWLAFRVRLLEMFGVIIGHHKRQHMSTTPRFLGLITDFSLASTNYTVSLQCCPTTKTRAMQMLSELLSTCKVTSGQAAKARGLLNWLEMSMLGRPLTAAFSGFIARQYFDTTESLTPELALCLQYLQLALSILPSRIVEIYQNPRPPVIIYTDASTEAPTALGFRLGI